jgi:hypothetical protein
VDVGSAKGRFIARGKFGRLRRDRIGFWMTLRFMARRTG